MKNFRKLEHVGTTWSLEQCGHEFVPKLPSPPSLLSPSPLPSLPPVLSSTKTMHSGPTTWQTPPVLGQNPTVTEEKEHTAQRLPPPELSLGWPSPPSVAVTTAPLWVTHSVTLHCYSPPSFKEQTSARVFYKACMWVSVLELCFQFASMWISEVYFYYCKKWRMFSVHILSGCLQKRLLYHLALVSWSRFYFSLILPEVQHIQPLLQIWWF